MKTKLQSGVALVITLLMLSVITFMTVAFLAVSHRNRAAVAVTMDEKVSQLMADAAFSRAQAEIVRPMKAQNGNKLRYDLMVSLNYINPNGFFPNLPLLDVTNVNYDHRSDGVPLTSEEWTTNIANLFLDPRPPVLVRVNNTNTLDFRFWVDVNQNGRFETNGTDSYTEGGKTYTQDNLTGEPEWIGVLQKPEYPHSATNPFVGRYAYLVCPVGKTLDLNYIHNYAKRNAKSMPNDGFLRNQGVGSWELNLAGYLSQLNTNYYAWGTNYVYETNSSVASGGNSFFDAIDLLRYRYDTNYFSLASAREQLRLNSQDLATTNLDMYSDGELQLTTALPVAKDDYTEHWSGSDNTNAFYDLQQLFNPNFSSTDFVYALTNVLAKTNTYDRYTFQRLLATIGTDSDPELRGKININYTNDLNASLSPTNFVDWTPIQFFTNTADILLRKAGLGTLTNIPVYTINRITNNGVVHQGASLYNPAVHRILQLAANIYDATTNSPYPSVFRPLFRSYNNTNYICGYTNDQSASFYTKEWKRMENYPLATAGTIYPGNVFGVPVIIGAKKGLPNFNELTACDQVFVSRKLQITKQNNDDTISDKPQNFRTNQMYTFSINRGVGVELWNSYSNAYKNLRIVVSNYTDLGFVNETGYSPIRTNIADGNDLSLNIWPGFRGKDVYSPTNILVPIFKFYEVLPRSTWLETDKKFVLAEQLGSSYFETNSFGGLPVHRWVYSITNRFFCAIIDGANGRLLDFTTLNSSTNVDVLAALHYKAGGHWLTNNANTTLTSPASDGVTAQIDEAGWGDFLRKPSTELNKENETPADEKLQITRTLQANDPLVHYTTYDLRVLNHEMQLDADTSTMMYRLTNASPGYGSIFKVNQNYNPWGLDRNFTNVVFIDPNVWSSDDWEFPTNKFPNIGWLGRVHRGTPWQTVFLKADTNSAANLYQWTNNWNFYRKTYPTEDWALLDCFTTSLNDNAARGTLSVNQTNVAAWSAVLSGVIALTNSFTPAVISPQDVEKFVYGYTNAGKQVIEGINQTRVRRNGVFTSVGDILNTPALTVGSPYVTNSPLQDTNITDAVVERIPQQILSLVRLGQPRFVIYSYGQSLKPKDYYLGNNDALYNICTNYQITGECVTKTVCHIEGDASKPRVIVDSFNILPGD